MTKAPTSAEMMDTIVISTGKLHSPGTSIVLLLAWTRSFFVAQEHMPQVVRPSNWADSSRNGGLGGGGTKFPLKRPTSVESNVKGEPKLRS